VHRRGSRAGSDRDDVSTPIDIVPLARAMRIETCAQRRVRLRCKRAAARRNKQP